METPGFIGLGELRRIDVIFRAFASGRGFHLLLDLIHDGLLHRAGDRVDTPGLEIAVPEGARRAVVRMSLRSASETGVFLKARQVFRVARASETFMVVSPVRETTSIRACVPGRLRA